ncbi:MAG TPA: DinB family protein [Roseiflexaceae bacterium]|nr:DinB family protein [Roseiflexaceae bacterium]
MASERSRAELLAALEHERVALLELMPRFDDARWRAPARADGWSPHDVTMHIADSTYGLALLVLGELQPNLPLDDRGWMEVGELNEQRRRRSAEFTREKVAARVSGAFDHARRAVETITDYAAPGPYGPVHTRGMWLNRIVDHAAEHRAELEAMLAPV